MFRLELGTRPRTWGFRLSRNDAAVMAAAALGAAVIWPFSELAAYVPLVVVAHFFLFCNVFRIRPSSELSWTFLFVVNTCLWWALRDTPSWLGIVVCQSPLTVGLIVFEMFTPRYHGIGANRLNRRLADYLSDRVP